MAWLKEGVFVYYKKYESERIYLSPLCVNDYQLCTKWVNDETLSRGTGFFKVNFTELNEKEWMENVNKKGDHHYAIVRKEDDVFLGIYGLELKDDISRRYRVGGFIGEKEERGKGYGTEALKLITKFGFEVLNAETIYSGIFVFNEASLKAAIKAGYTVAGKYRNSYFYNGEYHDQHCIEIIREDYINSKKTIN